MVDVELVIASARSGRGAVVDVFGRSLAEARPGDRGPPDQWRRDTQHHVSGTSRNHGWHAPASRVSGLRPVEPGGVFAGIDVQILARTLRLDPSSGAAGEVVAASGEGWNSDNGDVPLFTADSAVCDPTAAWSGCAATL